jgi:hypothetical protein
LSKRRFALSSGFPNLGICVLIWEDKGTCV